MAGQLAAGMRSVAGKVIAQPGGVLTHPRDCRAQCLTVGLGQLLDGDTGVCRHPGTGQQSTALAAGKIGPQRGQILVDTAVVQFGT